MAAGTCLYIILHCEALYIRGEEDVIGLYDFGGWMVMWRGERKVDTGANL